MPSKVYIVQEVTTFDKVTKGRRRAFDLSPATEFGELVFLLGSDRLPFDSSPIVQELREKLADFSDDDFLLPTGDPLAIGIATTFAQDANDGRVKVLRWVRDTKKYISTQIDFAS